MLSSGPTAGEVIPMKQAFGGPTAHAPENAAVNPCVFENDLSFLGEHVVFQPLRAQQASGGH